MTTFTVWLRITAGSSDIYASRKYVVDRSSSDGRRLAWINRYGAVDYHTFPYAGAVRTAGSRSRIYTPDEYRTVSTGEERSQEIISEQLDAETAEWLCGIYSSPRVWTVQGDEFVKVEVSAGDMEYSVRKPGEVSVTVSPSTKTVSRKF